KITLHKLELAANLVESEQRPGEPLLITYLEIFDRSAAYFFIKNPNYIWFGTGPNLISIPANNYVSTYYASFLDRADGLPQTIIYYFSRSGIFGLLILLNIFWMLRRKA